MSCGLDRLSVLSAKLEGKGIDRLGQRDRPVLVTHMIAKRHFLNQVIEGKVPKFSVLTRQAYQASIKLKRSSSSSEESMRSISLDLDLRESGQLVRAVSQVRSYPASHPSELV